MTSYNTFSWFPLIRGVKMLHVIALSLHVEVGYFCYYTQIQGEARKSAYFIYQLATKWSQLCSLRLQGGVTSLKSITAYIYL